MQLDEILTALHQQTRGIPELERALQNFAFEHFLKMPVVFTEKHGLKFLLYPGQNAKVYFENQGNYEVAETLFCERFIRPGMTLVDVGANIGMYTLLFAHLTGPSGRVISFEPEGKNFDRLSMNLALNRFSSVRLERMAVSDSSKELVLNVFPDSVNAWHSLGAPTLPDPWVAGATMRPTSQQRVPGTTLDDYAAQNSITTIDLLKVDVEGAELEVFRGASQLLTNRRVGAIMFEISLPQIQAMGHTPDEIVSVLHELGYVAHELRPDGQLGAPVVGSVPHYANYVALPRERR